MFLIIYTTCIKPIVFESWPIRNLLLLLKVKFGVQFITIICYREIPGKSDASPSLQMKLELPGSVPTSTFIPKIVGWEKNTSGKLGPRLADLAPMMDPKQLAETAVDLNLKLMRWRIMPDLKLDKIAETKCLLLGAGTLGCYVARGLMVCRVYSYNIS
jgi:ubiquitin-like modifier-activating enzyme ATG7